MINGGFGLLLDGSKEAHAKAQSMLAFDVNNGVARRAWAGNDNAHAAIDRAMSANAKLIVTKANVASADVLDKICG